MADGPHEVFIECCLVSVLTGYSRGRTDYALQLCIFFARTQVSHINTTHLICSIRVLQCGKHSLRRK